MLSQRNKSKIEMRISYSKDSENLGKGIGGLDAILADFNGTKPYAGKTADMRLCCRESRIYQEEYGRRMMERKRAQLR